VCLFPFLFWRFYSPLGHGNFVPLDFLSPLATPCSLFPRKHPVHQRPPLTFPFFCPIFVVPAFPFSFFSLPPEHLSLQKSFTPSSPLCLFRLLKLGPPDFLYFLFPLLLPPVVVLIRCFFLFSRHRASTLPCISSFSADRTPAFTLCKRALTFMRVRTQRWSSWLLPPQPSSPPLSPNYS